MVLTQHLSSRAVSSQDVPLGKKKKKKKKSMRPLCWQVKFKVFLWLAVLSRQWWRQSLTLPGSDYIILPGSWRRGESLQCSKANGPDVRATWPAKDLHMPLSAELPCRTEALVSCAPRFWGLPQWRCVLLMLTRFLTFRKCSWNRSLTGICDASGSFNLRLCI